MKTIKTLFLIAIIASGIQAKAQSGTGEIKGYVYDKELNTPLFNATVQVTYAGELIGETSDFDGKFNLKPLQPGEYILEVNYLGKETKKISLLVKSNQIALRDTIFLGMSDGVITPTVVIDGGYRDAIIDPFEVNKPTMRAEQLKNMPSIRTPAKLIVQLSEGAFTDGGTGDNEIYFRGSRSGSVITYLDGMKIYGTVPTLPAAAISSVSVYTGGLPAKFGDTSGGVVEIETKSYFELYNERMNQIENQR